MYNYVHRSYSEQQPDNWPPPIKLRLNNYTTGVYPSRNISIGNKKGPQMAAQHFVVATFQIRCSRRHQGGQRGARRGYSSILQTGVNFRAQQPPLILRPPHLLRPLSTIVELCASLVFHSVRIFIGVILICSTVLLSYAISDLDGQLCLPTQRVSSSCYFNAHPPVAQTNVLSKFQFLIHRTVCIKTTIKY